MRTVLKPAAATALTIAWLGGVPQQPTPQVASIALPKLMPWLGDGSCANAVPASEHRAASTTLLNHLFIHMPFFRGFGLGVAPGWAIIGRIPVVLSGGRSGLRMITQFVRGLERSEELFQQNRVRIRRWWVFAVRLRTPAAA
jgi:hypothetical protein